MKRAHVLLSIIFSLFLIFSVTGTGFGNEFVEKKELKTFNAQKWTPGEILVKFKRGVSENNIHNANQKNGASILSKSKRGEFLRLRIPPTKTVEEMVEIYRKNPNVEYAEPNFTSTALFVPNDPAYTYQWNFDNPVNGGIQMEQAWDVQTGSASVIVAVLDTGVAYENYDNFLQAPDLAGTSFVPGYDFINNDTHPNDDEGHGTHVTGTIAQQTDNTIGVAGIAFNVSIMPVKVLDSTASGSTSQIADGIYFAADNGADVINMSLGGPSPSTTMSDALAYAYNMGVTIVCAAGNEYYYFNLPSYPAAYDDYCIAVGATRYDETRSYYSNTGSYIDIVAPGGDVRVDQNGDGYNDGILQQTFGSDPKIFAYYFYQGTSMASPHVAAVAALLISNGLTGPTSIRNALISTAKDKGPAGWDSQFGWGIVDAYAALNYVDTDSDGISDDDETNIYGTDPGIADTDADGIGDGDELNFWGDPGYLTDHDGDIATFPNNLLDPDSDNDGLLDGEEINTYGSNPSLADTDSDGLSDFEEVNTYSTDPALSDTDGDGIDDANELIYWGDPGYLTDYDGDAATYANNLLDPDSDNDGFYDGRELLAGTNPADVLEFPLIGFYLQSNTSDGSVTFTDTSGAGHLVTGNGNVHHETFGLDTAINFDGTGDYLSLPDQDDWDFGTDNFTIDLWVNYTTIPSDNSNGIFGTGTWPIVGTYRYAMKINNGTLSWYDPFTGWVDTGIAPVADTWYHLAVVRFGDTLSIYVNGSETITA
ncbi:MAG: S8 family serine peptidase, partial [Desulfobacteraceae bacterium]|nr:S8 family serine peptidase [Desulfobacteraceae bacterium]